MFAWEACKSSSWCEGHGGNGFLKFQDFEEIANVELADAFEQMWQKRRYIFTYL